VFLQISVSVLNNNGDGVWYLDPVLVLHPDHRYSGEPLLGEVRPGGLLAADDGYPT
jgi:hypothetical protein